MTKTAEELLNELTARCASVGFEIQSEEPDEDGNGGCNFIADPKSSWPWRIHLREPDAEEIILSTEFEQYRPVPEYDAMWSASERAVECELICEHPLFMQDNELSALASKLGYDQSASEQPDFCVQLPSLPGLPVISIGWASPEFKIWRLVSPAVHLLDVNQRIPSIRIDGVDLSNELKAKAVVESFGTGALLELDRVDFKARLRSHYPWRLRFEWNKPAYTLQPVRTAPEVDPMSLYWQGRFAETLPAAFLGYYQVLEFYFPRYAQPLATKPGSSETKRRPEVEQFADTLRALMTPSDIRALISSSQDLYTHYLRPAQGIVTQRIAAEESTADLRPQVAKRLYQIRCRLVHTKQGAQDPVFLPLSAEASDLYYDVLLIRELARLALGRNAKPLMP